ncbi:MAG: phage holin family protein [Patescibacteria group bacterium]|nr:phage holin family protein [Patescibacteria group bacterium]
MWILFLQIIAGILGIFLAQRYIPEVEFIGNWQTLVLTGTILGLINFFIKPILKAITLPLRILTFGLFGLVINMLIVWLVDIIFPELIISGLLPLFWTSLIIWGISFILIKWMPAK